MRHLALLFAFVLPLVAQAETQTVKQGHLRYALIQTGAAPAHAEMLRDAFARVLDYDTAVELLAATPDDGVIGYALDTDAAYLRVNSAWVALASGSGILGSNGGTIGNETNNVWTLAENSEDLTLTYGTDTVTFASGTSATFILTPATAVTGDLTLNGGAGALTYGAASSSVVVPDNSATALIEGSTGRLDLLGLDTTDDNEKVIVKGTTTVTAFHVDVGGAQFDETITSTGDVTLNGGAGALTYGAASSSVVVPDNSATALVEGSTGRLDLLGLDTTDDNEKVIVKGTTTVTAFHVDVGGAQFDEDVAVTGDATLSGGAGALTFGAASSSVVVPDASATGLVFGSTGRLDLLGLDTQDGVEKVIVTGTTTQTALHVDVGDALFDEDVSIGNGLTVAEMTVGLDFNSFRVFDNPNSLLPAAGATDDLGLVIGTPGTNAASLQTEDLKAEGGNPTLNKAMFSFVVPAAYLAGSTVSVVFSAGMITTIADDATTLDLECWVPDYANADGTVSTDLVAEVAQDINSTTFADKTFTVDDDLAGHVLAAGAVVQCIVTTSVSDGATGTAVIAAVRKADVVYSD